MTGRPVVGASGEKPVEYALESGADCTFVLKEYDRAPAFSGFFPGIAGPLGIPLWAFYVNRGQAVCSFGTRSKDNAIMEFQHAAKAYALTAVYGFRTFLRCSAGGRTFVHEPFAPRAATGASGCERLMRLSPHELGIEEYSRETGLRTEITCHTLPGEQLGGLVRTVVIHNLSARELSVEILDGMPALVPFGVGNEALKQMGKTVEAWTHVENLETRVPFYRIRVLIDDSSEVREEKRGNFHLAMGGDPRRPELLPVVVDPVAVFGEDTTFRFPERYGDALPAPGQAQQYANRTPCAFSVQSRVLPPGGKCSFVTLTGAAPDVKVLNALLPEILDPGYPGRKAEENRILTARLMHRAFTVSGSAVFDAYVRQSFLDNILRGGFPHSLAEGPLARVLYLYSRKHGDLERDYNNFVLQPVYFSQGNGNFRDIVQNRRNDVWVNPAVGPSNIIHFLNLIQLDGHNPLVVKGLRYTLNPDAAGRLRTSLGGELHDRIRTLLEGSFVPGELVDILRQSGKARDEELGSLLADILSCCESEEAADHGEGYWVDHWCYILDLVESYARLFPERLVALLWEEESVVWYDDCHHVRPVHEKYVLHEGQVRQYGAVAFDKEKSAVIRARTRHPHRVRDREGRICRESVFVKLAVLSFIKLSLLDAHNTGLEMDADKPGWNDSLNGLPGLLGSAMPEVFQLYRLFGLLGDALDKERDSLSAVFFPEECAELWAALSGMLSATLAGSLTPFAGWQARVSARERYRERIRPGLTGGRTAVPADALGAFFRDGGRLLKESFTRALDPDNGLYHTYFVNTVEQHKAAPEGGILPVRFSQRPLPLFLEAQMQALAQERDPAEARRICRAVKASPLYDTQLGMYRLNASLQEEPLEIGRVRVFTPGWLENQSIFLHMHYKYLLALLKAGLHEEFYEDFRKGFVPFLDPAVYGRSILENSSFIVSSCNPDPRLHGRGYVARLSGSTAEVYEILLRIAFGPAPFECGAEPVFRPRPVLPGWLFTDADRNITWLEDRTEHKLYLEKGAFAVVLLGGTLVVYHNPARRDTFGPAAVAVRGFDLTDRQGKTVAVAGSSLDGMLVDAVREGRWQRIDIRLE